MGLIVNSFPLCLLESNGYKISQMQVSALEVSIFLKDTATAHIYRLENLVQNDRCGPK